MGYDVPPVTVIGLGNLGLPIATRLHGRGRDVIGSDIDPARLAAFRATEGIALPPDQLGPRPVVCLVLPDEHSVKAIMESDRRSALVSPGGMIILHSTVSPELVRHLAADCATAGLGFVDAPVSGGADRAAAGTLTALVGASHGDHRRALGVLDDLAEDIVHLGPPGAGSAAKLANQLMLFATLAGAYEAIEIARRYGLTEQMVLRGVSTGTGRSWVTENWGFFDRITGDYDAAGVSESYRPWAKDPAQAVKAARAVGLDAPIAALIAEQLPGMVRRHADQSPSRGEP